MPRLKESSIICIVAPAGSLKPQDLDYTIKKLKENGYQIELGSNLYKNYYFGYNYAGTIEERLSDMQRALDHPSAEAIWCARGGYGGVQIIDLLNWKKFRNNPKWFIGYSDNTVFHQYLSLKSIPSIHGMTAKLLGKDQTQDSFESVMEILNKGKINHEWKPTEFNQLGRVNAPVSGGNLSIIYSLIDSPTIDQFKDKILFIEDWQENWYHLDRMLAGLFRANVFEEINGLIVGSFTKMDDKEENKDYNNSFDQQSYEIIASYFSGFDIPKAFGLSAGHILDNKALIFGKVAKLNVGNKNVHLKI